MSPIRAAFPSRLDRPSLALLVEALGNITIELDSPEQVSAMASIIASAEAGAVADKEFRAIQEVSRLLIHMSQ